MKESKSSVTLRAKELKVSRQSLYYKQKKPEEDWKLKQRIEEVLREYPSYGSRRLSLHLKLNRKRIKRVMNFFNIKPYRRRVRRWKKTKNIEIIYPNLLLTMHPQYENHIWVSDFTHWNFQGRKVYLATVMDLYTRKIVGMSIYTTHAVQLVLAALMSAINNNSRPEIYHSDNGSEYNSEIFKEALQTIGTLISRSKPSCPWENGYQESFYSGFKIDLGDTTRFKSLGEFVYNIYQQVYIYNNTRIHSSLKMSPVQFALKVKENYNIKYKFSV